MNGSIRLQSQLSNDILVVEANAFVIRVLLTFGFDKEIVLLFDGGFILILNPCAELTVNSKVR